MKKIGFKIISENVNENVTHTVSIVAKKYSEPVLFIPKRGPKGNKKPSVKPGDRWFVYFYYDNPLNGKRDLPPIKFYKDVNRLKTVKERKEYGAALLESVKLMLEKGFDPYDASAYDAPPEPGSNVSVKDAFESALRDKKNALAKSTYTSYWEYLNPFLIWCEKKSIAQASVQNLKTRHVVDYLNYLGREEPRGKGLSATSVANVKRNLSAIFTKVKQNGWVAENFIKDIPTNKSKPEKHAPFTADELKKLIPELEKQPQLLDFIRFIFYGFMRNREIVRIRISNIDMDAGVISLPTKGDKLSFIVIVKPLRLYLQSLQLEKYPKDAFLFTPEGRPGKWDASEKNKVDYYGVRFRKIRNRLGISKKKDSYSIRHNGALDLYHSFIADGLTENEAIQKLLTITRHKSESALRNYLRGVGGVLPKDWSDSYTISF